MLPRRHRPIRHIADAGFELEELRGVPDAVVLRMIGELWLLIAGDAEEIIEEQIIVNAAVRIELRELTFIDGVGLAAMDRVVRLADDTGCELTLVGPVHGQVARMLALSDADWLLARVAVA